VGTVRVIVALLAVTGCNQVLGIKDPVAGDATTPGDGRPDDSMIDGPEIDAAPACTTATAFGAPITSAVGGTGVALVVAKFDAGASQDVAISVTTDTVILSGNNDGSFAAGQTLGTASIAIAADDFDLIGARKDLLLVTAGGVVVRLQKENGPAGVFDTEQALTGPFTNANAAGVAELGGNLIADVAIHDDAGITPFISNATAGTFSRGTTVGAGGDQLVLVRQIDNANDADALLVDSAGNVKLALSNGSDGFGTPTVVATGAIGRGVAVGKFDDDNLPDLIVATAAGGVVYLQNAGSPGTFTSTATFTEISGATLMVADVNGDGLDDVVTPTAAVLQCPTTHALTQKEPIDATPPALLVDVTGNAKLDLLRLSGTDLIVRVQ